MKRIVIVVLGIILIACLLSGSAAETTFDMTGYDLAKSYLPEENLYHSDTGKVWYCYWQKGIDDAGRRTVGCIYLGPVTLPETENMDRSIICTVDDAPIIHEFCDCAFCLLGIHVKTTDRNPRAIYTTLQVKASDGWFMALTEHIHEGEPWEVTPGEEKSTIDISLGTSDHGSGNSRTMEGLYRIVASRQTGDRWALSVRVFSLEKEGPHFQVVLK